MPPKATKPRYFGTPTEFREWLEEFHATATELLVGYHRKDSGRPSMTWPESVDTALCYGWIDGVRKRVDEVRYTIRFSPRRPGSTWSSINIRRAEALITEGRMTAAGLAAFAIRKEYRSGIYSYEQRSVHLPDPYGRMLRKNKAAWTFLQAQPPSYRKIVSWWILSAKREATRLGRLERLTTFSARGERIPGYSPGKPPR